MSGRQQQTSNRRAGFTIVELMIATLVFSLVMILITVGVLSFTKSYYKGVNQSTTQNAARSVLDRITQDIQFSGGMVTSPIGTSGSNGSVGFCIGNKRYSYALGKQLWDEGEPDASLNQSRHALLVDESNACAGANAQDVQAASGTLGTELLQRGMRLSKLSVEPAAGAGSYTVSIRVLYGDDDLINNPTSPDANCKVSISGSQYCAQSELTTVVQKRIGP